MRVQDAREINSAMRHNARQLALRAALEAQWRKRARRRNVFEVLRPAANVGLAVVGLGLAGICVTGVVYPDGQGVTQTVCGLVAVITGLGGYAAGAIR